MLKKILYGIFTAVFVVLSFSAALQLGNLVRGYTASSYRELAFFAGFALYLVIHFLLYRPVFAHVMAHELTHMLWGAVFGAKTKSIYVSKDGGKVLISKSNFLISLAPYFFPLYALFALGIYAIARDEHQVWLAGVVGAALAFHIALTIFSLTTSQTDLKEDSNIVFSLAFVLFMNMIVIAFILSVIAGPKKVEFPHYLMSVFTGVADMGKWVINMFNKI
ncbi:MAG: hypothetical protein LLG37_02920 [Spirochaetia bacterium]|nr:hypothetical protein [Spirochaetia bacterium]